MGIQLKIHIEANAFLECCGFLGDFETLQKDSFFSQMTPEEQAFIEQLRQDQAVGLSEFFIHSEGKSYEQIIDFMTQLSENQFYYYLHNENVALEEIEKVPFAQKTQVKQLALSVLEKCYATVQLKLANVDHEPIYKTVFEKLKTVAPLELAQELMGKRFYRISDYTTYYFIPVHCLSRPALRIFNEKSLALIFPTNEKKTALTTAELSEALRVIADPTRLQMMELLKGKAMYGKEIAEALGIKAATITHHIEQLNKIGLLHTDKSGQIKYFSLNRKHYTELLQQLSSFIR